MDLYFSNKVANPGDYLQWFKKKSAPNKDKKKSNAQRNKSTNRDANRFSGEFEDALNATAQTILSTHQDENTPPLSAGLVADWCSVKHETQYSRLFRS